MAGKSTGLVTNTRVTHATPAAAYAHTFNRDMESFNNVDFTQDHYQEGCRDIADQLIALDPPINVTIQLQIAQMLSVFSSIFYSPRQVVLGGGRQKFMMNSEFDLSGKAGESGDRADGRNLIYEWKQKMEERGVRHAYVWNKEQFDKIDGNEYEYVLGLFSNGHMAFELDRKKVSPPQEPSIVDMTLKAIEMLSRNPNGYFLLVESGKIDHG